MSYKYYELPVCYLANGLELKLPVHEFKGGDGPVLGITAAIHGDETITVEIARLIVEQLKKEKNINGTIKVMPLANPLAYEMVSRFTPIDGVNMNRVFPGNPDRTVTEIQAHVIAGFLESLDLYIDIHAGGQDPVVDYTYVMNDEGFSRAFGSRLLYRPSQGYPGTSATITQAKNIPSVTLECGGGPNVQYYVDKGVKGIINMLRYKNMIDGEAEKPPKDQILITHIEHVNPHHCGMFVPAQSYESMEGIIKGKGTVLGRIYNPMTLELLEEIKAPFEENLMILMRCDYNRILAGDFTFMIGDLNSEVK